MSAEAVPTTDGRNPGLGVVTGRGSNGTVGRRPKEGVVGVVGRFTKV